MVAVETTSFSEAVGHWKESWWRCLCWWRKMLQALVLSSLTALPQQQQPYTASSLFFADVVTVNHSGLLTVSLSQTVCVHCFSTFLSTLPFIAQSIVYLESLIFKPTHLSTVSLLISQGNGCNSAHFCQCSPGLETHLCNADRERHRGRQEQTGRELDSKQNPDFINVGLLIWAWAALHLSQQEQHTKQAAKTHLETQPDTYAHIQALCNDTHKLIPMHKSALLKSDGKKQGCCQLYLCLSHRKKTMVWDETAPCSYSTHNDTHSQTKVPYTPAPHIRTTVCLANKTIKLKIAQSMTHSDVTSHIESISPFLLFLRHDKQIQCESQNTNLFHCCVQ